MPITTAANDNFSFFFLYSEKTSLDISCESSAWQTIHLKCQDLFSLKNKKTKKHFECRLLQILLCALKVNSEKMLINKSECRLLQFYLALLGLTP